MKKALIALTLTALVAVCFSSCKKTCTCTVYDKTTGTTTTVEQFKTNSSSDCIDRAEKYASIYTTPTCTWAD